MVWGGITSPGNDPQRDDGGRDRHARDGEAVRRHGGALQLARSDAVRPGAEAGSGGAGQPHRVGGGGRRRIWRTTYPERHVAGAGADAYMQLSGTSMAAAVVSGAVALLLEQEAKTSRAKTKAVLQ